jgi:hypothetical protein
LPAKTSRGRKAPRRARTVDCRDAEAPGAHTAGVAAPMRGRTPLETDSQMLPRYCAPAGWPFQAGAAGCVGVIPGRGFPAPPMARRDAALTGQFGVILQWARIVTEWQSGTATSENLPAAHRYPENIARGRSKSDGRARLIGQGFHAFFTRLTFSYPRSCASTIGQMIERRRCAAMHASYATAARGARRRSC